MCGIAGILSRDGKDAIPLLRDMLEAIKHRGPNGAGIVASGKVSRGRTIGELDWNSLSGSLAMGHTRLAVVVGGAQGQQPLVSDDGQIFLLHNGEIYNHKTLRNHLKKHYHFATQTDSEVLIHSISEH
jgi:asparagine synthase (glutamine-hydrolysing)